jgi:dTDP-4-dehydrorhamnose 3,5-epimerase
MRVERTGIADVLLLEPRVFEDARGFNFESYNRRVLREEAGIEVEFVQENRSGSLRGVLRGLHYQVGRPQGKLVCALRGEIYDVAVDLRRGSPTFGKWQGFRLSEANRQMVWIPAGFAHGFLALSEAEVLYKLTEFWAPESERTILWSDRRLGIAWPLEGEPIVSARDARGVPFEQAELL